MTKIMNMHLLNANCKRCILDKAGGTINNLNYLGIISNLSNLIDDNMKVISNKDRKITYYNRNLNPISITSF